MYVLSESLQRMTEGKGWASNIRGMNYLKKGYNGPVTEDNAEAGSLTNSQSMNQLAAAFGVEASKLSEMMDGLEGQELEDKVKELCEKGELKLQSIANMGTVQGIN